MTRKYLTNFGIFTQFKFNSLAVFVYRKTSIIPLFKPLVFIRKENNTK